MSGRIEYPPSSIDRFPFSRQDMYRALTPPFHERLHIVAHRMPIVEACLPSEVRRYELLARATCEQDTFQPATFLPMTEDPRIAAALDLHMLELALDHAAQHPDMQTHVNMAPQRLLPEGSQPIFDLLDQHPLAATNLCIELLENTSFSQGYKDLLTTLHALSERGVELFIDDVPIGSSTHSNIRSILQPLAGIKIDGRSFQQKSHLDRIKHAINLTRFSGRVVIVEGVETEADMQFAHELGATHLQGYHIGRPELVAAA